MAEANEKHDLTLLTQTRAIAVDALDEVGLIESLMFHYNKYRGLKAFLLDIDQSHLAYKGVSSFLVATSPDAQAESANAINDLKTWILNTLAELKNPNITLVISCPASQLYRFADVIDKADPPLANIDFAPLHEFEEVVSDAKLKYDLALIEHNAQARLEGPPSKPSPAEPEA